MSSYPLSDQQLLEYVHGTASKGWSGGAIVDFLSQLGYTKTLFVNQLEHAGYTAQQASSVADSPGSELKNILAQIGNSAVPVPGISGLGAGGEAAGGGVAAGAEGAAGGAAAGTAGTVAQALKTLTGVVAAAKIWNWLTTPANWLGVLKFIGGAIAIYLGVRGLSGADAPKLEVPGVKL